MKRLGRVFNKVKRLLNYDFNEVTKRENEIINELNTIKEQSNALNERLNCLDDYISDLNNNSFMINKKIDYLKDYVSYGSMETLPLISKTSSDKKKILICGFYGAFNLGDELMLNKMLENIEKAGNYDITIMLCDNPYTDMTRYGKYKFIHYPKTRSDLNHLALYYDCLIFGGGALIDDVNYDNIDSQMTLGYILINLTMRFITFDKKTILYGLSTNDKIENLEFIKKLNYIINNCTYFSLRDTNSLKTLKKANIDVSNVKIVDDIVFAYDFKEVNNKGRNIINVGIIYITSPDTRETLIENLKKIIIYLNENKIAYNINFIPFYDYLGSDVKFYNDLKDNFGSDNIKVLDYEFTFEKLQTVINDQDYIISMRYHGSLIANMLNKKVLSIVYKNHRHYQNKMNYLYENYGFEKNMQFNVTKKSLDALFKAPKVKKDKTLLDKISKQSNKDIIDALKKL